MNGLLYKLIPYSYFELISAVYLVKVITFKVLLIINIYGNK